ncbi:Uma2 family endonuclease [Thermoleptolyngbya sichuanensis XZ-Cy5]|uniref:Uma2 family endonuclease n=1 Tax=Thermoleptolyngbya sichuanensis TaxID=2885951 RepID=UPI00240E5126|nr:Uma2 family endonuclease [Thermoleptolyngbya sichuanensis]MDG2617771.1 Uma2 family endonuclease [Thermoleptolyngbya sichuanensis XZ-Cy5]
MLLELKRWVVPPGHQVLLRDVSWSELEQILEELGEHRAVRISYSSGLLELMTPLPEHEDDKVIISDFVKILLEEQGREFRNLGSTTFKHEQMDQAVEPDECFYIQHEAAIRGKKRIDLGVDPPPDLVIEIDITARTRLGNYEKLRVPELWRYDGEALEMYVLQGETYSLSSESLQFPGMALQEAIPYYLEMSKTQGRTVAMRAFRDWVQQQMKPL